MTPEKLIKLGYFFKYLKAYKWYLIGIFVALIFSSFSVLSIGVGIKLMIDEGFSNENVHLLNQALLILLGITVTLAAATYTRYYLVTKLGDMVVADIRRDVYRHLLSLSPGFFEISGSGKLVSRLIGDTTLIQTVTGSSLSVVMRNILILIGGLGMMIYTSPELAGIVAAIVPVVVVPIVSLGRRVRKLSAASQEKIADLSSFIEETISAIKTIQAYTKEEYERQRFTHLNQSVLSASLSRIKIRALLTAIVIILTFGAVGLVLWFGGHNVLAGDITAGSLSAFIFYAIMVSGAIGAISEVFGDVQRAAGAADGLVDLLATKSEVMQSSYPVSLPDKARGELEFEKVTFFYPSRKEQPALEGISLQIKPGEKVAIVGASGAGKSTVLQLALRFYDPTSGKIKLDGVDISKLGFQELRKQFAIVPQDPTIFSATVFQNIVYGKEEASKQEVIKAAKSARAYNFVKKLPEGFDTFVGEKGIRLSGGEKQRVAIARAILRKPKILLLDEATSALDSENEQLVQTALEELMSRCTTIVIAHRLSTILKCDRIIVLEKGVVVQEGTHEELIGQSGVYARLAALQFGVAERKKIITNDESMVSASHESSGDGKNKNLKSVKRILH